MPLLLGLLSLGKKFKNMKFEYSQLRHEVKTGDAFGTAGPSFFSKNIRFWTGSKISHVGLFVWIGTRLFIVESMEGKGVHILPASKYIKENKVTWMRVPHEYSQSQVFDRIFSDDGSLPMIGDDYDMKGALLSPFWDTESAKTFCSEYDKKILNLKFPAMDSGIKPINIANRSSFYRELF